MPDILHECMQAGDIQLVILGNKVDMAPRQQSVPEAEARAFADAIGAQHLYVSAKTGQGIEAAVTGTARRALAAAHARPPDAAAGAAHCSPASRSDKTCSSVVLSALNACGES